MTTFDLALPAPNAAAPTVASGAAAPAGASATGDTTSADAFAQSLDQATREQAGAGDSPPTDVRSVHDTAPGSTKRGRTPSRVSPPAATPSGAPTPRTTDRDAAGDAGAAPVDTEGAADPAAAALALVGLAPPLVARSQPVERAPKPLSPRTVDAPMPKRGAPPPSAAPAAPAPTASVTAATVDERSKRLVLEAADGEAAGPQSKSVEVGSTPTSAAADASTIDHAVSRTAAQELVTAAHELLAASARADGSTSVASASQTATRAMAANPAGAANAKTESSTRDRTMPVAARAAQADAAGGAATGEATTPAPATPAKPAAMGSVASGNGAGGGVVGDGAPGGHTSGERLAVATTRTNGGPVTSEGRVVARTAGRDTSTNKNDDAIGVDGARDAATTSAVATVHPAVSTAAVHAIDDATASQVATSAASHQQTAAAAPNDAPAPTHASPTATTSTAPTTSHPAEAWQQVAQAIRPLRRSADGTQRLTVRLDPPELGPVHVELSMHRGELSVHLVADSEAARDALHASLGDLRSDLDNAGLHTANLGVATYTGDSQRQAPSSNHAQSEPPSATNGGNDNADPVAASTSVRPTDVVGAGSGSGRLDLRM